MASNRLMISTKEYGDEAGISFTSYISSDSELTRITLNHGWVLDGFEMHYNKGGQSTKFGGVGGNVSEIVLQPGEFITTISGNSWDYGITQLRFTTNKGVKYGPYGNKPGNKQSFTWNAGDGAPENLAGRMGLHSFGGRYGSYIQALYARFVLYGPVPTVALPSTKPIPSSNVKFEQQVITPDTKGAVPLSNFARVHKEVTSGGVAIHVGPAAVVFYVSEDTISRIPFFRAALQGVPQEAHRKLKMPEDKPEILSALLEHLCSGSYTYTYDPGSTTVTDGIPATDLAQGLFHASVYHAAFTYGWKPLVDDTVANFLFVLSKLTGMDIIRLWRAAYRNKLSMAVCASERRMKDFENALPGLLNTLYETDPEEMMKVVYQCPEMINDFLRIIVSRHVK